MKRPWIPTASALVVTVLLCSCTTAPDPREKVRSPADLEAYLDSVVRSGSPPGMSLAVVKGDSVVYKNGFGWADEPRNRRASAETVYHWWSCTKIVTAIAVLQLQEQGQLALTDPVVRHLPYFDVRYPSGNRSPVTIQHLLTHSSGLSNPSALTLMQWIHHSWEPAVNQTAMVKRVLPDYRSLEFEPGTRTGYSNLGYMVLGAIIERVAGVSYEEYVRQHILQPLGMEDTDFLYLRAQDPNEAAGAHPLFSWMTPLIPFLAGSYVRQIAGGHIWMRRVYTDQTPSTGLIGPVTDAAKLVSAFLNGGVYRGRRILLESSISEMIKGGQITITQEGPLDYRRQGIGWRVHGHAGRWAISHDGGGPGFITRIQIYPDEGLGIVLFANDATCDPPAIVSLVGSLKW